MFGLVLVSERRWGSLSNLRTATLFFCTASATHRSTPIRTIKAMTYQDNMLSVKYEGQKHTKTITLHAGQRKLQRRVFYLQVGEAVKIHKAQGH